MFSPSIFFVTCAPRLRAIRNTVATADTATHSQARALGPSLGPRTSRSRPGAPRPARERRARLHRCGERRAHEALHLRDRAESHLDAEEVTQEFLDGALRHPVPARAERHGGGRGAARKRSSELPRAGPPGSPRSTRAAELVQFVCGALSRENAGSVAAGLPARSLDRSLDVLPGSRGSVVRHRATSRARWVRGELAACGGAVEPLEQLHARSSVAADGAPPPRVISPCRFVRYSSTSPRVSRDARVVAVACADAGRFSSSSARSTTPRRAGSRSTGTCVPARPYGAAGSAARTDPRPLPRTRR